MSEVKPNFSRRVFRIAKYSILVLGTLYLAFIGILLASETSLVYPAPKYPTGDWQPKDLDFEEVSFKSADGTKIVAWFLPRPSDGTGPSETVLLCHGNAQSAPQATAHMGDLIRHKFNANVLVFDYRGYGKSDGIPAEPGILADTEAAMAWLNQRTKTKPNDVVVFGLSIGGGPAVHIAWKEGAKALVLLRTFGALPDPAAQQYWFVPVRWLMRNQYPSAEKIKTCTMPLLQSHGDKDTLIPFSSGRRVYDNSPSKLKMLFINRGGGHWTRISDTYWDAVKSFLDSVRTIEAQN